MQSQAQEEGEQNGIGQKEEKQKEGGTVLSWPQYHQNSGCPGSIFRDTVGTLRVLRVIMEGAGR